MASVKTLSNDACDLKAELRNNIPNSAIDAAKQKFSDVWAIDNCLSRTGCSINLLTSPSGALYRNLTLINSSVCEDDLEIKGTVLSEDGAAIPYASVFIKGTTIGVAADSTGRFKMNYPGQEDSVVLVSSCVGFQTKETSIDICRNIDVTNVLLRNETLLSGEVYYLLLTGAAKLSFINGFHLIPAFMTRTGNVQLYMSSHKTILDI